MTLSFPGLTRLGLCSVKSVAAPVLMLFILAFPSLTHLDLSCTCAMPALLPSGPRTLCGCAHSPWGGVCFSLA
jgi:hypothetical protein